jgi:hypothetical protein
VCATVHHAARRAARGKALAEAARTLSLKAESASMPPEQRPLSSASLPRTDLPGAGVVAYVPAPYHTRAHFVQKSCPKRPPQSPGSLHEAQARQCPRRVPCRAPGAVPPVPPPARGKHPCSRVRELVARHPCLAAAAAVIRFTRPSASSVRGHPCPPTATHSGIRALGQHPVQPLSIDGRPNPLSTNRSDT